MKCETGLNFRRTRLSAEGANTEGEEGCLLSRMGGVTIFRLLCTLATDREREEGKPRTTNAPGPLAESVRRQGPDEVIWFQEKPVLQMGGRYSRARYPGVRRARLRCVVNSSQM
jgi:hypothetical protein